MMHGVSYRISRWLIEWRGPLLVVGLVTAVMAYGPAHRLRFDRSIENMFAADDPILVPYRELKRIFGGNEIALAAYVDPELLTLAGLERVERLTEQMQAVPGVDAVLSLTTTPVGVDLYDSPLREPFLELFQGYTIGADLQTTAVVCMLEPAERAPAAREVTVQTLRALIEEHDPTGVLTGEPVMVVEGFQSIEDDGQRLGLTSTLLLMLTIVLCFRSLRWVIVPVAVVNLALWLTQAMLVKGNFHLSMVSSMLWAIVTVTGIAMVIHIIVHFRERRDLGHTPREALLACGAVLVTPIVWTCVTDACGFGSLLAAHVGPVHDFGIMMSIGSLVVLVAAALVLPGLVLLGSMDSDPKRAWGEQRLEDGLYRVVDSVEHQPRLWLALTVVVVGLSAVGYRWLDVETDFTKNFRSSSNVVRSYAFVETHLGGAGVWDILIPAPEPLDEAFVERIRKLEHRLRTEVTVEDEAGKESPGLTKVMSLADAIDALPLGEFRSLMPLGMMLSQFQQQMPTVMETLMGEDPERPGVSYFRIMLRARERQPAAQKTHLIEQVRRISGEEFAEAEVTGFFLLLTNLIESMVRDQWLTFSIACAAIFVMMLLAFRSLSLAVVALVPNMLPIIVVTGLMGWLGIRINMGAAMIAAVSVGLSVDSSIHYITSFLAERRGGRSMHEAISVVHQSVGRAMFFSTLALMVGFSALMLSEFVPTIYFGILVSISMFGGMLGNLVVLPVLLRMTARWRGEAV